MTNQQKKEHLKALSDLKQALLRLRRFVNNTDITGASWRWWRDFNTGEISITVKAKQKTETVEECHMYEGEWSPLDGEEREKGRDMGMEGKA